MKYVLGLFFIVITASVSAQFKLYEKGFDQYKQGRYDQAIDSFSEYLTKSTRDKAIDVEVFYLRGLSYYKSNHYTEALGDFEESILRDHDNKGNIYWFRAKCFEKLNHNESAIDQYTSAMRELADDPKSKSKILEERNALYTKMGKPIPVQQDVIAKNVTKENTEKKTNDTPPSRSDKNKPAVTNPSTVKTATVVKAADNKGTQNKPPEKVQPVVVKQPTVEAKPTLAEIYKNEKRYALVIGNANYGKSLGALKNSVNDASDMAKELEKSNFEVQLLTNATYGQMRAAMLKFKETVDGGGDRDNTVALFYYAGHGLQYNEENYLVPVDALVEFEDDISRYCFPAERMVLGNMERSNSRMNILILDACRSNSLPSRTRSVSNQGLGEMRRAKGSFIAYATAPGSVASDGTGKNGLYTQELLKAMRKPGLTIEQVFKEVRANVLKLSNDRQNTWDSSNIIGDFYFKFE